MLFSFKLLFLLVVVIIIFIFILSSSIYIVIRRTGKRKMEIVHRHFDTTFYFGLITVLAPSVMDGFGYIRYIYSQV